MPDDDLVRLRASNAVAPPVAVTRPAAAVDPVCGMTVDVSRARFSSEHGGRMVYFCAVDCRRAFDADPAAFAPT